MSYLLFFRTLEWFGLPDVPEHPNMIVMMLTLKIIGLAFERNSVLVKARDTEKVVLTPAENELRELPVISMIHYCFNYIGLVTGNN